LSFNGPKVEKVNIAQKFRLFSEFWSPRIVGAVNDSYIKLVKVKGEFVIIPKGVEHKPVADSEAHLLLLERSTAINTGNIRNEKTVVDQWL